MPKESAAKFWQIRRSIGGHVGKSHDKLMQETEAPVRRAYILVCEKCGTKLMKKSDSDNPSRVVQKKIKKDAAESLGKGEIRPMVTSCLDICPDDKIAACIVPMNPAHGAPKFVECEPELDAMAEALLNAAKEITK